MDGKERAYRHRKDLAFVTQHATSQWARMLKHTGGLRG